MKTRFTRNNGFLIAFCLLLLAIFSCEKHKNKVAFDPPEEETVDEPTRTAPLYRGADIGWLDQMEKTGFEFYNTDGNKDDALNILKDHDINAVRLRVWVDPSDDKISGHCSPEEVIAMAKRAHEKDMEVMINFHYSDSWADPGKQNKPKAWENHDFEALLDDVYQHTHDVIQGLVENEITPKWVQIGNEIIGGMLWPEGSTDHWDQLAQLLNQGYKAVKDIDKNIAVIVHVDQGNDRERTKWFYDLARDHHVNYDIIGLSYYPYWLESPYQETIGDLEENLAYLANRYDKPVMIVEIGGKDDEEEETYAMLKAVIDLTQAVPDEQGLGVFYWEPQGARSWSHYPLSCWKDNGQPTKALSAFKIE